MGRRETQVPEDHRDCRVNRENREAQGTVKVRRDRRDPWGSQVILAHRAHREKTEDQDRPVLAVHPAWPEDPVSRGFREEKVHPVAKERKAIAEDQDYTARKEIPDFRAFPVLKENPVPQEFQAFRCKDPKAWMVRQEWTDCPERKERGVFRVREDLPAMRSEGRLDRPVPPE